MKKIYFLLVLLIIATNGIAQSSFWGITTVVAGGSSWGGFGGDGDTATAPAVDFCRPTGVWVDSVGDIYIYDMFNARVRKVNATTHILTTIAGNGTSGYSGDGGPAPLAEISTSWSSPLAGDNAGNVFIGDGNGRIRKVNTTTGIITTVAGGGSLGDGNPATAASISSPSGIYVDASGNIYLIADNSIRKVTATTGIITTIAGNGTSGFSGDGGPATAAQLTSPYELTGDASGNIYFTDNGNNRIRKINAAGIITTIAGNGVSGYSGDGGLAVNAQLSLQQGGGIGVDSAGNIYFTDNNSTNTIRKITVATGIINTVAENTGGPEYIYVDRAGNIYYTDGAGWTRKITNAASAINTMSVSDSLSTPSCTLPATVYTGVYGTVNGTPGPNDSVTVSVGYGQFAANSTVTYKLPYWYASGTYGFGAANSAQSAYTYTVPGTYTPVINITTLDGFTDQTNAPTITVSSACDSNVTGININSATDNITTGPCAVPANIMFTVGGSITGIPALADSAYIVYQYNEINDTSQIHVVPYVLIGGTYCFSDTFNLNNASGVYYGPQILVTTSSGLQQASTYLYTVATSSCNGGSVSAGIYDTSANHIACSLPYTDQYTISGSLSDYADTASSVSISVNFGDGTDTNIVVPVSSNNFGTGLFTHTYTMPGNYTPVISDTAGGFYGSSSAPQLTLGTGCAALSGLLYIDANGNCTPDAGEVRLGYWPYTLINNTTGQTTYGWCDDSGYYSLEVANGDNYTMVADPFGYLGGYSGNSITASCPTSGAATFTAVTGSGITQNFAFACAPPSQMDMSVSGWGWGFVPGDTGIIGVWSSNAWGYMCDSLSATITLTIDPLLTYIGMWDGPAPSTISGNTLTWAFSTQGDLFDFTGDVKVVCSTGAPYGANVCNTLYVSPSAIPDPDTTNNTYTWCEPVNSSWDPNEKQVSPRGTGAQGYIANGTPLSYLIHFQNTGTAPAQNIVVTDTINSNLDISTLQVINSSAPVQVYQVPGNIIKFQFSNINLPDSFVSSLGSIGYIAYNILPLDSLVHETQITNNAAIYFDYNPAVVTNTTLNTISAIGLITGPQNVCAGAQVILSDTVTGGEWNASNSNAGVAAGVVTGIAPGTDTISYTNDGMTVSTVITVNAYPSAATILGADSVCIGTSATLADSTPGGLWHANNSNLSIANGVITGVAAGTDTISYSVTNTCGTATVSKVITVSPCNLGITSTGYNPLEIYPNPANGVLTIKMIAGAYSMFTITNSIGQTFMQQPITSALTDVDIKKLPVGAYYITLKNKDGNNTVRKFVKM